MISSHGGGGGLLADGLPAPPPSSPPPMCVSPIPLGQSTPKSSGVGKMSAKPSIQPVLAERYVLGMELGRGAHGHVYQALDKKFGQFVAVKQISLAGVSKENLTSVMGEIELLKDLNHKHIVKYFDSIKTRNHLYIVLEYMENGSLANVIKPSNFGTFSEDLVSVYIAQVLEGLKYLHSQGVVHRDVKGANILTTKEGLVKLADFGVAAKLQEKGTTNSQQIHHNTVAGTPYWMAPEVIELTSVTKAADIWSVGCLVVELLTGTPPYFDCQPIQALYRIVQDDCPPLPDRISSYLENFLMSCFQKEPSQRLTAEQLLQHDWITHHRMTLKSSWSRNEGLKKASQRSRASVSAVIERILQHQARTTYSHDHDQVPTPEIAESPIGIFRTGSAPVSPGSNDMSIQPPLPRADDALVPSPSSHYPVPAREWEHRNTNGQTAETVDTFGPGGQLDNNHAPTNQSGRSQGVVEEFDAIDTQPNGPDGDIGRHWLGTEIGKIQDKKVPVATVVFEQHLKGDDKNGQGRVVDPLSSAALFNTVGSQWNIHFDTMKSINRMGVHDVDRMEQMRIRKHVNNLGGLLSPDDIATSTKNLIVVLRSMPEKKSMFFSEGGIVGIMGLLYSTHQQVLEPALELVLLLCDKDPKTLQSLCAVGIAPAIFRYSSAEYPANIRKHAALFMEMMCFTNISTLELFVICQGIHWIAGLLEEAYKENTLLTSIGLSLVEQIIRSHTGQAEQVTNSFSRLFAATNLPRRLVLSLIRITQILKEDHPTGSQTIGSESDHPGNAFGAANGDGLLDPLSNSVVENLNHGRHHSASGSSISNPSTSGLSEGPVSYRSQCVALPLEQLAVRASTLFLMLSTRDTIVRSHLCPQDTLKNLLKEVHTLRGHSGLQLKIVKALKNISSDPELLTRLQNAEAIEHLVPLLDKDRTLDVRKEVLQLMSNLCKMSPERRIIAERVGIIPHLRRLAGKPKWAENPASRRDREERMSLRKMAVEILCSMLTVSTDKIRASLWNEGVFYLLIQIVNEDQWQTKVLDALAAWLEDDTHQIETTLVVEENVLLLVAILQDYRQKTNEVSRVLEPILRMLERSDKLSRSMGQNGLAPVIVDMLRWADAATCLMLLRALRRIYAMHLKPKEFIKKYDVQRHLHRLASPQSDQGGEERVLVQKHARDLLRAFQMNQIW